MRIYGYSLAATLLCVNEESWRRKIVRTFLTRDIPQLGITVPVEQLRRSWLMVAHYHAQTWNASKIAGSLGINYKTAQHYLDILTGV